MLAYVILAAVVIRTKLEVPDNRLCNCFNAQWLRDSDEIAIHFCPVRAKCDWL